MIKELEQSLMAHNIKPTTMRLLVFECLMGKEAAVSLTDLYQDFEKSDRTTIYRTLKVFEENGMIHSIDDGTGVPKYAMCEEGCNCEIERDLHLHFHCRICGQTKCLTSYKIPEVELPPNHIPEEANLVVKGVCGNCSENK
ncbi:transcriptional repressor [uncultured Cyclobacterium sp.]|jgi:Fur family ferric uptake transcriptional regulator|tara:strand:+ start:481 stop:903 length:423 start_codon:yes stop_codon:yes gene_type:complete